jgi:hypothetical protein
MKRILAIAILAAAALTTGAGAQPMKSDFGIQLNSCSVPQSANHLSVFTGGAAVDYMNTRPVAATEVDFLVSYNGADTLMVDSGTFTKDAQVQHTLKNGLLDQAWTGQPPTSCRVYRVIWADGQVSD